MIAVRTLSLNQDLTPAEEQIGKHRDDDRRQDGDQAEQPDQPDLEARTGESAPALHPHLDKPLCHQRSQEEQQYEIEIEQREDDTRTRPERRRAGQRKIGRDPRSQRRGREGDRDLPPQAGAAGPAADPSRQAHSPILAETAAENRSTTPPPPSPRGFFRRAAKPGRQ